MIDYFDHTSTNNGLLIAGENAGSKLEKAQNSTSKSSLKTNLAPRLNRVRRSQIFTDNLITTSWFNYLCSLVFIRGSSWPNQQVL